MDNSKHSLGETKTPLLYSMNSSIKNQFILNLKGKNKAKHFQDFF